MYYYFFKSSVINSISSMNFSREASHIPNLTDIIIALEKTNLSKVKSFFGGRTKSPSLLIELSLLESKNIILFLYMKKKRCTYCWSCECLYFIISLSVCTNLSEQLSSSNCLKKLRMLLLSKSVTFHRTKLPKNCYNEIISRLHW